MITVYLTHFRLWHPKLECFDGATRLNDTHDAVHAQAGNSTWIPEFIATVGGLKKYFAEAMLWLINDIGLCCAIVGDFSTYLGGKLVSEPNLLTLYIAYRR